MGNSELLLLNSSNNNTRYDLGNESLEEYLVRTLGPKRLPLVVVLPITAIYVTIFVSGIIGNVAVCVVIVRNKLMWTATNYYLFSLAVSDLTLLILGLPYDLGVYWQQYPWVLGETLCKLRALGSEMSSYTSVLTIVAFSTERYLAICQPIHSYITSSPRTALRVICLLWCVSLLSATPFAVYTKIHYVTHPQDSTRRIEESAFCGMLDDAVPTNWPMYELSAFLFFLGPMLVIAVLYIRMGLTIQSRMIKFPGETKHLDSRTKPIIRMLAAVVITFFLCWAPFHMQRLFYLYGKDTPNYIKVNEWAYYITGCFYYFSCTVNPVLYNVMSVKYRLAFRKTLCCGQLDSSITREASTYRDTTVVYVDSHLEHRRSSNNIGELRRPKSFSRHSRNNEIPNNALEKKTHAISRQNSSSSSSGGVQDQSSARNCHALLDSYESNGKCQSCSSNQRHKCDKISDLIVTVTHSHNGKANSYSTTKSWPKVLLRPTKKTRSLSGDSTHVTEPCLGDTQL